MVTLSATRYEARIYAFCSTILKKRKPDADEEQIKALGWRETIMQAMDYASQDEQDMMLQMAEKIKNSPDSTDVEGDSLMGHLEGQIVALESLDPHLLLRGDITMSRTEKENVFIDGLYYHLYTSDMATRRTAKVAGYDFQERDSNPERYKNIRIPQTITYEGDEYTVDEILEDALIMCDTLISVDIPDTVRWIGENAFQGCDALESIVLPPRLTSIQESTFNNCSRLKSVEIPNGVYAINEGAFDCCNALEELILPDSVKRIEDVAFNHCPALTKVLLPDSLESIGRYAFGCSPLTSCNLPDSVKKVGLLPFIDAKVTIFNKHLFVQLKPNYKGSYSIPDGITTIANGALANQPYLTSIVFPDSLTQILSGNGTKTLQRIECHALVPPKVEWPCFNVVDRSIPLCVPAESIELYRNAFEWKEFTNIQPLPTKKTKQSLFAEPDPTPCLYGPPPVYDVPELPKDTPPQPASRIPFLNPFGWWVTIGYLALLLLGSLIYVLLR